jgi:hypothetical protein
MGKLASASDSTRCINSASIPPFLSVLAETGKYGTCQRRKEKKIVCEKPVLHIPQLATWASLFIR